MKNEDATSGKKRTIEQSFREAGISKWERRRVALADLNVDLSYQRELRDYRLKRILARFNPVACDPLIVIKRADHMLWLADGNHRRCALQQLGFTHWEALVVEGLDLNSEALIWLIKQTERQGATSTEQFRVRLLRKESEPLAIAMILHAQGFELFLRRGGSRRWNQIQAVTALEFIYDCPVGSWRARWISTRTRWQYSLTKLLKPTIAR